MSKRVTVEAIESDRLDVAPAPGHGLFPVVYSILSADALLTEVAHTYPIGLPMSCRFLQTSLNDTYLLTSREDRYIVRVYWAHWRTPSEIAYELELLAHLMAKGVSVSVPIAGYDGALSHPLAAPEGTRHLVLFTYARGEPLSWDKEEHSYLAGRLLAAIHAASDDFTSRHARFRWDLDYLIDTPLAAIRPFLSHRPEDWSYLVGLAARLRAWVAAAAEEGLDWGVCHGDLVGKNIHVAEDDTLTIFDFDNCGYGWRAYDLAVVLWSMMYTNKSAIWDSFLSGYTAVRRLAAADLAAVPLFCAISHLWVLGIRASRVAAGCSGRISKWSFDRELTFFREWEAERIEGK